MPPALILTPPALVALAAIACGILGRMRRPVAGVIFAAGSWLAAAAFVAIWAAGGRAPLELALGLSPGGIPFAVRLDAVVVVFELLLLVPVGLVAASRAPHPATCALAASAVLAAAISIESASALLTAFATSICATFLVWMVWREDEHRLTTVWVAFTAGWLLLLWSALLLEVTGGTSVFVAAPIIAFNVPLFLLFAGTAFILAGLLPWRSWVVEAWSRSLLDGGILAVATMVPVGFLLISRAYSLGGGRWPAGWLNPVVATAGGLLSLWAGLRAQGASDLRGYLSQVVPFASGLALVGIALGTPLGIDGGLIALLGLGVLTGLAPLLASGARPAVMLGIAIAAGVPPALIFGGWLLTAQAAFVAGSALGFIGVLAALAWLLGLAASARAVRLPQSDALSPRATTGIWLGCGLAIAAGVGLAAVEPALTLPATGELVKVPASLVAGAQFPVGLAGAGWQPLLLGLPLLALAAVAVLLGRRASAVRLRRVPDEAPPALVQAPAALRLDRIRERTVVEVPADYRTMLDLSAAVRYVRTGRPWFWVLVTLGLAVVVTR